MREKAAYLKGLVEGLGIDETTKEGKVIKAMSELLCEMAQAIDGIDEDVTQAYDQINDLSEELEDLEADLYEDDEEADEDEADDAEAEEDEDDNADVASEPYYEVACPAAARPSTSARTIWTRGRPSAPAARSHLKWRWPTMRKPKRTTAPCSTR